MARHLLVSVEILLHIGAYMLAVELVHFETGGLNRCRMIFSAEQRITHSKYGPPARRRCPAERTVRLQAIGENHYVGWLYRRVRRRVRRSQLIVVRRDRETGFRLRFIDRCPSMQNQFVNMEAQRN